MGDEDLDIDADMDFDLDGDAEGGDANMEDEEVAADDKDSALALLAKLRGIVQQRLGTVEDVRAVGTVTDPQLT